MEIQYKSRSGRLLIKIEGANQKEAFKSLAAKNGMRDKRTSRKRGRLGGNAKRDAAVLKRAEIAAPWVLDALVKEFGPKRVAELLDNKISEASLRRFHGNKIKR